MGVVEIVRQLIEPLSLRVRLLAGKGTVKLSDDSQGLQTLQLELLPREVRGQITRMGQYGFSSRPRPGAEALCIFLGGNRDAGYAFAVDDRRDRVRNLAEGEVAIFSPVSGARVHCKADGTIEISAPNGVTISTPTATVEGNLVATGDVSDGTGSMATMRTQFNTHVHPEHDGGSTGPPAVPMS